METALYAPERGCYAVREPKADFYTAPELHPAFARVLDGEIAARLARVHQARPRSRLFVVEMGSGGGTLARQVLTALRQDHEVWFRRIRYVLVERVEPLLLDSIVRLQDTGASLLGYSRLEDMPPVCGVFFSNELFDALPAHVLVKSGGEVRELYVRPRRKHGRGAGFKDQAGALSDKALADAARAVTPGLQEGGAHAVCLESRRWLETVSRRLRAGAVLTVDYGKRFGPADPNPPRGFVRHAHASDLLANPGRQDLTASVDFSRLADEGEECGLKPVLYTTLSKFLLERGILGSLPTGETAAAWAERAKIKTLFHPEGMGEVFKVLIQEKGVNPA